MKRGSKKLSSQVKRKVQNNKKPKESTELEGNPDLIIPTGSTLLDLAISGGRVRGGGLLAGILVEAFGPSSSGKTVLLCEIAGAVQRQGGGTMFFDPEARLDKQFAQIFDLDTNNMGYETPDRVPEVFKNVRDWNIEDTNIVNGAFADSLAALSTDLEMEKDEGDKMGGRRAKEFSEQLRKTARIIKSKNLLMVCSNQIRQTMNSFGPKYTSPGGEAIGFYSSVRLQFNNAQKVWKEKNTKGKKIKKVVGVETQIDVAKNSTWKPYRSAPIYIDYDYGIDDIRTNLQFIKDYTSHKTYTLDGQSLHNEMDRAIRIIEKDDLEEQLKEEVIDLWEEIERKFVSNRKKKKR